MLLVNTSVTTRCSMWKQISEVTQQVNALGNKRAEDFFSGSHARKLLIRHKFLRRRWLDQEVACSVSGSGEDGKVTWNQRLNSIMISPFIPFSITANVSELLNITHVTCRVNTQIMCIIKTHPLLKFHKFRRNRKQWCLHAEDLKQGLKTLLSAAFSRASTCWGSMCCL